jgi:hypothetical protein
LVSNGGQYADAARTGGRQTFGTDCATVSNVEIATGTSRTFLVPISDVVNVDLPSTYRVTVRGFRVCSAARGSCFSVPATSNAVDVTYVADVSDLGEPNQGWAASLTVTPTSGPASEARTVHLHLVNVSAAAQGFTNGGWCDFAVIVVTAANGHIIARSGGCHFISKIFAYGAAAGESVDEAFPLDRVAPLDVPGRYYVILTGFRGAFNGGGGFVPLVSNAAIVDVVKASHVPGGVIDESWNL